LLAKKKKGQKTSSRLLSRSLKKAQLPSSARHLSAEDIQEQLKVAYQEYYKVKSSAQDLRKTALETLAEAIASSGNTTKENTLKALRE